MAHDTSSRLLALRSLPKAIVAALMIVQLIPETAVAVNISVAEAVKAKLKSRSLVTNRTRPHSLNSKQIVTEKVSIRRRPLSLCPAAFFELFT